MAISLTSTGVTYPDGSTQTKGRGTKSLLATLTASNSATLAYTGFSSSYNNYELVLSSIIPVTNAVTGQLQFYMGGAYASGTYYNSCFQTFNGLWQGNFAQYAYYAGNKTFAQLTQTNFILNSRGLSGTLNIWNANSASYKQLTGAQTGWQQSAGFYSRDMIGITYVGSTAAVGGFQYYMSSGNILSGTIKVYGWN